MLEALLTKEILTILAPVVAAVGGFVYFYFKGRGDGARAVESTLDEARETLEKDIKKAQKDVNDIEQKRQASIEEIRKASKETDKIIKLWNKKFAKDEEKND